MGGTNIRPDSPVIPIRAGDTSAGGAYSSGTIQPTPTEYGVTYANAGISAISSLAGAFLGTKAFEAQLKAQTDAKIANMNLVMSNYEYQATKLKEDFAIMDSMFADKVSERALQGMKDYATMKAAAAETGTSGGSTKEATIQAHSDMAFDIGLINQKRRAASRDAVKTMERSEIDAINSLKSLASGGTHVEANALLSGLAGFSSALGGLLTTMPKMVTAEMFGYDVNATNKVNAYDVKPRG